MANDLAKPADGLLGQDRHKSPFDQTRAAITHPLFNARSNCGAVVTDVAAAPYVADHAAPALRGFSQFTDGIDDCCNLNSVAARPSRGSCRVR